MTIRRMPEIRSAWLLPLWMFIWRFLLSTRNTPANASPKGTTALLKMLLEHGIKS